jgi:hypothetical protein
LFDVIYGHAQENGYQKEGGVIMQVNPLCKYDYVPLLDYKGNEMTFESYYNHVKALDTRMQAIHAAVPHLRNTVISDMVADDQGRLPYVFRHEELTGYLNGVLCIQTGVAGEPYNRGEHGPDLKFFTNEETEENDLKFTVRKFFPITFKPEWTDVDVSWSRDSVVAMETSDCNRMLQTMRDQGFFENIQEFAAGGRVQKWPVAKLLLAFMGRALFKTGAWDDYAFMVWLHGASRFGKTLVNFILSQFFPQSAVVEMTTQGETTFGKEALINKSLIWFTDPKKPKKRRGLPY